MNDEVIEDLKQFITVTISQHISDLQSEVSQELADVRSDIRELDTKLSKKIDDLSDSVGEAIQTSNDSADTQLKDFGQRIIKLEQKTT